ncbi:fructosamine kinase family protein [Halalkaliarchaeum sp. AArc-GB]|uniref:fructosamine kinase family protein n=1 Tax=Halalkaliarchaeum sp. AArc-GB TaxID=3074078 RepID=UPI002867239C|nr:fructosamine kinase family protein [Halalkaliarchaeum sp. AArc-GB]MDR5672628.1 fructosamine kinase family protein [Halalkaliarchaeum sp. AArc-GB]
MQPVEHASSSWALPGREKGTVPENRGENIGSHDLAIDVDGRELAAGWIDDTPETRSAIDDALANRVEAAVDVAAAAIDRPVDPGLIHGDVWRTNLLASDGQLVAFLDPACYYADPEIELAYADWTGAFGEAFFDRYDEVRGIDPGFFERRRFVYRLYPLLVHVHLFGGSYESELVETLQRIHGMDDRT